MRTILFDFKMECPGYTLNVNKAVSSRRWGEQLEANAPRVGAGRRFAAAPPADFNRALPTPGTRHARPCWARKLEKLDSFAGSTRFHTVIPVCNLPTSNVLNKLTMSD